MPIIEFDGSLSLDDLDRAGDNFGWANVRMSKGEFTNHLSTQIQTLECRLANRAECPELLAAFESAAWEAWDSWAAWEAAAGSNAAQEGR